MIGVVVAGVVVALLVFRQPGGGIFSGLGIGPVPGGADGSPQAQGAAAAAGTTTPGNSEQQIVHGLESAIGGVGGAAVCTYYGAGAVAPLCAKAGSYLGPKAVQLGNFTTNKTVEVSVKSTVYGAKAVTTFTRANTAIAAKVAGAADRTYDDAGKLPAPLAFVAKASLLPIKIGSDFGAKAANTITAGASKIESGVKSAGNALESGVSKVLGWL